MAQARRGIEPIVAAILLIVITVVAAILLYLWFSGYLSTTTSRVSVISSPEQFQITGISASLLQNGCNVTAYVQNLGTTNVTITNAYILDSTTQSVICAAPTLSVVLSPGSTLKISVLFGNCPVNRGSSYLFKVVSSRGSSAIQSFIVS